MRSTWLAMIVVLWLLVVAGGMALLLRYNSTPGQPAQPPQSWPAQSEIRPSARVHTLVMLAHPRCACTRASVNELAAIMSRLGDQVTAHVVFMLPDGLSEGWERTDLWRRAAEIPGVQVLVDEDGLEAARFGSNVSGQTLLYSPDGRLLFSGGITSSRGHEGDNAGRRRIVSLVTRGKAERNDSPVFGCELSGEPITSR